MINRTRQLTERLSQPLAQPPNHSSKPDQVPTRQPNPQREDPEKQQLKLQVQNLERQLQMQMQQNQLQPQVPQVSQPLQPQVPQVSQPMQQPETRGPKHMGNVTLDKFEGRGENPIKFWSLFIKYCSLFKYTENDTVNATPLHVSSTVQDWFYSLEKGVRRNQQRLKEAFFERFQRRNLEYSLQNIKQHQSESSHKRRTATFRKPFCIGPERTTSPADQHITQHLQYGYQSPLFDIMNDDNVVTFKNDHPPTYPVVDCDNETTIPYMDDQTFFQSSPIHSNTNYFISSWTGQPTVPTSITALRLSIIRRPSIPSSFTKRPAPLTNRLQTPQHFSSVYPKIANIHTSYSFHYYNCIKCTHCHICNIDSSVQRQLQPKEQELQRPLVVSNTSNSAGSTVQPPTNIFNMSSILKIEKF
ncbi:unnamed protein product [Mytilus coruscus]|uniref:Retrotransposon gag domain-containing protein n=1 Tax=Mytilus coruscus TaxID=42192 RepID=A0A6J8CIL5_MYTCO|nr:unnamed protein product [Mytilus coruscus]